MTTDRQHFLWAEYEMKARCDERAAQASGDDDLEVTQRLEQAAREASVAQNMAAGWELCAAEMAQTFQAELQVEKQSLEMQAYQSHQWPQKANGGKRKVTASPSRILLIKARPWIPRSNVNDGR